MCMLAGVACWPSRMQMRMRMRHVPRPPARALGPCMRADRGLVEGLLALGASRLEATEACVKRALRTALLPLLNQMSVMGL